MAVTHGSTLRATLAQATLDGVDSGAGPGVCVVMDNANVVLATVTLQDPAFSRSGAVLTLLGVPLSDLSADAAGTADHFEVRNSSGVFQYGGSVTITGGGGDMTVDNPVFAAGQRFNITAMTYTAPL